MCIRDSHIYGYPESEKVLQIIRDFCEPMLDERQEAMSRFNEFYYVFFLQYTSVDSIKERIGKIHEGIAEAVKKQQKRYFLEPHTGIYRMAGLELSLIHISEPTRLGMISYAVFCLKKKKQKPEPSSAARSSNRKQQGGGAVENAQTKTRE